LSTHNPKCYDRAMKQIISAKQASDNAWRCLRRTYNQELEAILQHIDAKSGSGAFSVEVSIQGSAGVFFEKELKDRGFIVALSPTTSEGLCSMVVRWPHGDEDLEAGDEELEAGHVG